MDPGAVPSRPREGSGPSADGESPPQRSALRIQTAAVAAQQAALDEEEVRLRQRRGALEQQEEQLAAHLEEKRKRLLALQERTQNERCALHADRNAYEAHVAQVTGDLGQAQRELLEQQQQLQAERRRLGALVRRFKKRTQRACQAERNRIALREEELANEECNLAKEREAFEESRAELLEERLSFNADYELGRRQLQDAWERLRNAQGSWRRRRRLERAALTLRGREVQDAEVALAEAQDNLARDKQAWEMRRLDLEHDIDGLRQRCNNHRLKLLEQQQLGPLPQKMDTDPVESAGASPSTSLVLACATSELPVPAAAVPLADAFSERLATLERLAGELADQRLELAEQWQRLVETQRRWEQDQAQTAAEFEALVERIGRQEESFRARQQARANLEAALEQRHQELSGLHQQLIGWRARLHAREHAWEGERARLLAALAQREELAETQLNALGEFGQRWTERRRDEMQRLDQAREEYERLHSELTTQRRQVEQRSAVLEDEQRKLTEKALALEQLRQEFLLGTGDSARGERRLQRLRRRWLTQHAATLRALKRGREALQAELATLNTRAADLERHAAEVSQAQAELSEEVAAWEHKQILANTRHSRLQHALQNAHAQRACLEQELSKTRDEIERLARSLLDEPNPPTLQIEQAA